MNSKKKVLSRYIENSFSEKLEFYDEKNLFLIVEEKLKDLVKNQLSANPPENQKKIYSNKKEKIDYTFYSGTGGNIYSFWRYYLLQKNKSIEAEVSLKHLIGYFNGNKTLLEIDYSQSKKFHSPSFFQGPIGIHTMGCLIAKETNSEEDFLKILEKVINFKKLALDKSTEYEVLYGTAGYLFSLLFIKTECGKNFPIPEVFDIHIYDVYKHLYQCGVKEKHKNKSKFLLYPWSRHYEDSPKTYIGAVHGIFGVIYMLIKTILTIPEIVKNNEEFEEVKKEIYNTLINLISLQFEDGNFPSSLGSETNKLVHFCHGAPGSIYTLSLAYQYYKEEKFLKACLAAGELIWQKGLLRKGNSVCHGITGNAITLFEIYRLTGDEKWKARAFAFASATCDREIQKICGETDDPGRLVKGTPDTPYSLMEGQAGLIAFYSDLLSNNVIFPGFEIVNN